MFDVDNVFLGACRISWGGNDMGYTQGGVDISIKTDLTYVEVDQFGDTYVDQYITKRTISVKFSIAETDVDSFNRLYLQFNNSTHGAGVIVRDENGLALMPNARPLALYPGTQSDIDGMLVVPAAIFDGSMDFSYKHDNETLYLIEFRGLLDQQNNLIKLISPKSVYNMNYNAMLSDYGFVITTKDGTPIALS